MSDIRKKRKTASSLFSRLFSTQTTHPESIGKFSSDKSLSSSPPIAKMSHLPAEPEFEQAYKELVSTLENSTLFEKYPEYRTALEVVSIPERVIQFRVVWEDDAGKLQVNRGYRVQFNSALGPYKGGLRFHPTVNLSILKFLGFEQIFKNALTGLNMGGGKGGADFDPKGKSENEIRRFCDAFMRRLCQHIGAETDVPAGDIGVGGREVGFMFGTYRKERNKWEGVLTGKGMDWGGSLIRPEATGYGLVYYVEHMIKYAGKGSLAGKRVAISGSGNVAQYAALKCIELGATVVSLSDSKGCLIAEGAGVSFTPDQITAIADIKLARKPLTEFVAATGAKGFRYIDGARPWVHVGAVDIALPSATQNEVSGDEARALVANAAGLGALFVAEGSNMGCTQDAIDVFEAERLKHNPAAQVWYAPGKASNCGGVAVSGLEMAQNSQRITWSREEVDGRLQGIMKQAFDDALATAHEYVPSQNGELPSLVAGSNIAGFVKVVRAMQDQGDWWKQA
ncbi:putative Glutamate/Leucine/Phenylalanine/Valine dehydrogenase [Camillea tinctor]|nr:putative Glutamate/Leucine/Phenylalanine/Valine dehydrogenase [Camillea tinctor]